MHTKFILAALGAALTLQAVASPAAPIVIKFSHVAAPESAKAQAAGRVRIELYPNSTLYQDAQEMAALARGDVQMLAPLGAAGLAQFEVFEMPYIFPDRSALYRITDGKIGKELFKRLEPKGIVGLAYWDHSFKAMSANRPLINLAAFKG